MPIEKQRGGFQRDFHAAFRALDPRAGIQGACRGGGLPERLRIAEEIFQKSGAFRERRGFGAPQLAAPDFFAPSRPLAERAKRARAAIFEQGQSLIRKKRFVDGAGSHPGARRCLGGGM